MIINTENKLKNFLKKIQNKKKIYLDTEFHRKNTYFGILSYISIYDGDSYWIFDVIKNPKSIAALEKILLNKKKLKIMHGSLQDLEILKNYNLKINNLFDTQIAANFLNYQYNISYKDLVRKICKKKINKEIQNYDWTLRPLTKKVLNYLKNDVKFLKKIHDYQSTNLKKQKKIKIYFEEMSNYLKKNYHENFINNKLKKELNYKLYTSNIFEHLLKIRSNIAKKNNLPKNWVLSDESIIKLIKNSNNHLLNESKVLSKKEKSSFLKIFRELRKIKFIKNNINQIKLKSLEFFRFLISKKFNICEELIATKVDLSEYLHDQKKKYGWRYKFFYKPFEFFLKGQISKLKLII